MRYEQAFDKSVDTERLFVLQCGSSEHVFEEGDAMSVALELEYEAFHPRLHVVPEELVAVIGQEPIDRTLLQPIAEDLPRVLEALLDLRPTECHASNSGRPGDKSRAFVCDYFRAVLESGCDIPVGWAISAAGRWMRGCPHARDDCEAHSVDDRGREGPLWPLRTRRVRIREGASPPSLPGRRLHLGRRCHTPPLGWSHEVRTGVRQIG